VTVKIPDDEDKRRAELIQQGVWPGPPRPKKPRPKGK
jgi:hypothetical protein